MPDPMRWPEAEAPRRKHRGCQTSRLTPRLALVRCGARAEVGVVVWRVVSAATTHFNRVPEPAVSKSEFIESSAAAYQLPLRLKLSPAGRVCLLEESI